MIYETARFISGTSGKIKPCTMLLSLLTRAAMLHRFTKRIIQTLTVSSVCRSLNFFAAWFSADFEKFISKMHLNVTNFYK